MSHSVRFACLSVEVRVAVIDGDLAVQRFLTLHLRPTEAEAFRLRRNSRKATVPLHDVVVTDGTFVGEAIDAAQIARSGAPGVGRLARGTAEAPVRVRQETANDVIAEIEIGGASQTLFAGKTSLGGGPKTNVSFLT